MDEDVSSGGRGVGMDEVSSGGREVRRAELVSSQGRVVGSTGASVGLGTPVIGV